MAFIVVTKNGVPTKVEVDEFGIPLGDADLGVESGDWSRSVIKNSPTHQETLQQLQDEFKECGMLGGVSVGMVSLNGDSTLSDDQWDKFVNMFGNAASKKGVQSINEYNNAIESKSRIADQRERQARGFQSKNVQPVEQKSYSTDDLMRERERLLEERASFLNEKEIYLKERERFLKEQMQSK